MGRRELTPKEIDDIVWGIAEALMPLRPGVSRVEVEGKIRERVDDLKSSLHLEVTTTPAEMRAIVDKIDKRIRTAVANIKADVERLPTSAAFEFWKVAKICGFSFETLPKALQQAFEPLVTTLGSRRGPTGHVNRTNAASATVAYELMQDFSTGEPSGSDRGPFRTIAELLFEAVTGRKPTDRQFKRACDNQLHFRHSG